MELSEFNSNYLANLLQEFSLENKILVLLGDFNTDLLNYSTNSDISNFLDSMYSSLCIHPHNVFIRTLPFQLVLQHISNSH